MSEPDEAMLWAREKRAQLAERSGFTGQAADHRAGRSDHYPHTIAMAEAHRAGQAAAQAKAEERVAGLEAENARLRQHIADEANRINIAGSAYDRVQAALDEMVTGLKMRARKTLAVPHDAD